MASKRDKKRLDQDHAAKMPKPGPFASLRNSFFTGVVIAAPLFITVAVVYWLVTGPLANFDGFVQRNIPDAWLPPLPPDYYIPGLGVLVAVIFLVLLGVMAKNFIGRFLINFGEQVLDSMPVVRNLYGFFKNVFEMALQQSEQSFKEVALIEYPRPGLWTLCFIVTSTKGEAKHLLSDLGDDMTNVFVPTTPNPTSGFLLFVPRSELRILEMTVEEGAKMIFSAGLVAPEFVVPGTEPMPEPAKAESTHRGFNILRRRSGPAETPVGPPQIVDEKAP
ncbi:DUF502 domain-containing protein [Parvularcula sp. LCG005]|uniref:DUF502 domain-containing protein n=1 Tax=Parvularcula sp. LCG005 TaxID=3078805 RepID=UPI0029433496|nr:DUF502 domain-containing protein [Parvularcula sp. LCG005]WOI54076.1 DUF502 domain-containing protein [Parvularcula sp. LCG005]